MASGVGGNIAKHVTGHGRATALVGLLTELVEATDGLTMAVERHDLAALVSANERAEALTARIDETAKELTPLDKVELDKPRIAALQDRLEVAARRNAYLIERAWALEASTVRLLMSLGRPAPDSATAGYVSAGPSSAYLDRQA